MHAQLARVAAETLTVEHWLDDNMRNIPDHYHAHARPQGGFFGHGYPPRGLRSVSTSAGSLAELLSRGVLQVAARRVAELVACAPALV